MLCCVLVLRGFDLVVYVIVFDFGLYCACCFGCLCSVCGCGCSLGLPIGFGLVACVFLVGFCGYGGLLVLVRFCVVWLVGWFVLRWGLRYAVQVCVCLFC